MCARPSGSHTSRRQSHGAVRLRAPVPDDAPAVLAVIRSREQADFGMSTSTLGDIRDAWDRRELNVALDAVVIETDDDQIVAYADVDRRGTFAVVAAAHEGRGIGSRLLCWAQTRERDRHHEQHRQWVAAGNTRARALLHAAGYQFVRSHQRMARPLDQLPAPNTMPGGMRVRPLDVDRDAIAMHALDNASFSPIADYQPASYTAFCDEHLRVHDLDAEISCVAGNGDTVVAFLLARRWQARSIGYLDLLAVHPDHQRRGIATALLHTAFAGFAAAGLRAAQLAVASDNPRAIRLYERLGMRPSIRFDTYARSITGA